MAEETRYVTCVLCEASCGLEVRVDGPHVRSIRGHRGDPLSRGHICPKAVALQDIHEDPDRLRRPVRRVGPPGDDARWEEMGWDEAIELVATRLVGIQQAHGRDAVAVYLGNPNVHSLGAMTHGTNIARVLRTHNTFSATSVDQLPHQLVSWALYGHQFLIPVPDLDRTDLLLVIGGNPMASNGSLMTSPDFPARMRALRARNGRLVVIDPRRTETARIADEHHFVRPGTDVFLLLAMLNVLLGEGLARPAAYVRGVDALGSLVGGVTPEAAEAVCGVPAESIRRVTRELAAAPAAAVYGRLGVSTQVHGVICQWAIQCLNALTGNLDRPGGTMLTSPAVDAVGLGLLGHGHMGRWHSRVRGVAEYGGELPSSVMAEEMTTPGEGQIRALVTMAGNPVASVPGGSQLATAIAGLDFRVAIDFYVNETTSMADVILPPTDPLERDHYDLVFHLLAVRNTARWSSALFPKPEDARHDWEIARDLCLAISQRRREGMGHLAAARARAEGAAAEARWRTPPRAMVDVLLRSGRARTSVASLASIPGGLDLGPLEPRLPERLMTADKSVDLAHPVLVEAVEALAASLRDRRPAAPADGELLLIGRRHLRDNNSWMHNLPRLTTGRPRHRLLAHPDDLSARGIRDGDLVTVTSRSGEVTVEVGATEDMMPGVVSLPHGYGHDRPGVRLRNARMLPGASANDLTDPEVLDVLGGTAVVNGVPVQVRPADVREIRPPK